VPWTEIVGVTTRTLRNGATLLALDVARPASIQSYGTFAWLGRWERSLTKHDLSIGLRLLPLPPEVSLRLVRHCFDHPEDRRHLGSGIEPVFGHQ
jgi:hypothetical protein